MMTLIYGYDKHLRCWNYEIINSDKKFVKGEAFLSKDEIEAIIDNAKREYPDLQIIKKG